MSVAIVSTTKLSAFEMDSLYSMDQVQITTIKQGTNLRDEAISVSILNQETIQNQEITSMKQASTIAPNFYIPDYGSRITSSIYVRGLGARIDQPVVGLNIDNVPYINKNSFDIEVMGIDRMEILRGPQSTLYGRNTMGGVINIYTISPFNFQGLKFGVSYGTGNTIKSNATVYHKFSDKLAASIGAYYNSTDGYFTNETTQTTCDTEQSVGGRLRVQYLPTRSLRIENTFSVGVVDQGGYAYENMATGSISYNDPSSYERTTINNGLTMQLTKPKWSLASITSYQYLNDAMTLDNDFTPESLFTLRQAIQEHSITEDVVFRSTDGKEGYGWTIGVFGLADIKDMQAPVVFKEQGIEQLILENAIMDDTYEYIWDTDSFTLSSDFRTYTYAAALYHESSYTKGRFKATIGARLDYEQTTLEYHSYTSTGCKKYSTADGTLLFTKPIEVDLTGSPTLSFTEFLPKASVVYQLGEYRQSSVYATVAKGYKAGGYNTQMFSDILQQEVMSLFGLTAIYSAEEIIAYKPEYSWNYEVGTHILNPDRTLLADVALFYIDCRDQQLTIFPDGMVTGRMMTNAGHSRSYGVEAALSAVVSDGFRLNAAYGYTNAKFITYDDNEEDYAGNYVPYAPMQTISANAEYSFGVNTSLFNRIALNINTNGVGRTYWSESNDVSQPLYMLLGSEVRFVGDRYTFTVWGRNITNVDYNTFYFESIGNQFVSKGRPATFGVTLNMTL